MNLDTVWTVSPDGAVTVETRVERDPEFPELPRFGLRLFLDMGDFAKYAWFFISYTLLNAGFYTANNIAYSALTALITKNSAERVQMGFMFAFGTSLLILSRMDVERANERLKAAH